MPKLGNPLTYDLLELADQLAEQRGRVSLQKASLRRATSTAYYAAFHALCFVCADELVGWSESDDLEPIYRSVEHREARKRLTSQEALQRFGRFLDIGSAFETLQKRRHDADYASPGGTAVFRGWSGSIRDWASDSIALARQLVDALEQLDPPQRRQLAILLIAKARTP